MTKFALFVAASVAMVIVASASSDSTDKKEVRQSVRRELGKTGMGGTSNATRKKVDMCVVRPPYRKLVRKYSWRYYPTIQIPPMRIGLMSKSKQGLIC